MLNKKQAISLFVILGVSLLSCLAIAVPFGIEGLASNVFQIKYEILPLVLLGLMIVITAYLIDGSFNPFLYFRF